MLSNMLYKWKCFKYKQENLFITGFIHASELKEDHEVDTHIDECVKLCIKEITTLDKIKGFLCKRN